MHIALTPRTGSTAFPCRTPFGTFLPTSPHPVPLSHTHPSPTRAHTHTHTQSREDAFEGCELGYGETGLLYSDVQLYCHCRRAAQVVLIQVRRGAGGWGGVVDTSPN